MNESMPSTKQAFDQLARNYDSIFTNTNIGKMLRQRTHELLDEIFLPEDIVLVLNCGTGEDVLYLASRGIKVIATDSSAEMIKYARIKIKDGGLENRVIFKQIDFDELDACLDPDEQFDGVVSNFGGLNCSRDLTLLAGELSKYVRVGGRLYLCIMGRFVPWEWFYLGLKGNFSRVIERISGSCMWRGRYIKYYTPGSVIKSFSDNFRAADSRGLGFLLPPSYAGSLVSRYPDFFQLLNRLEKKIESCFAVSCFSDHFIVTFLKK